MSPVGESAPTAADQGGNPGRRSRAADAVPVRAETPDVAHGTAPTAENGSEQGGEVGLDLGEQITAEDHAERLAPRVAERPQPQVGCGEEGGGRRGPGRRSAA